MLSELNVELKWKRGLNCALSLRKHLFDSYEATPEIEVQRGMVRPWKVGEPALNDLRITLCVGQDLCNMDWWQFYGV